MQGTTETQCTAFAGQRRVATGKLTDVARAVRALLDETPDASVLIFDNETSHPVEVDFRGSADEVLARLPRGGETAPPESGPRGPGRPKLGVVPREVTLLPRHWEWLAAQPGGASVALRKLVEDARRANTANDRARQATEAAYRFMVAIAGNAPNFDEAARALFAGDRAGFEEKIEAWPEDIREHLGELLARR